MIRYTNFILNFVVLTVVFINRKPYEILYIMTKRVNNAAVGLKYKPGMKKSIIATCLLQIINKHVFYCYIIHYLEQT